MIIIIMIIIITNNGSIRWGNMDIGLVLCLPYAWIMTAWFINICRNIFPVVLRLLRLNRKATI